MANVADIIIFGGQSNMERQTEVLFVFITGILIFFVLCGIMGYERRYMI